MKIHYVTNFGGMPFFFNISSAVGRGYPNANPEDVAFVQFCFATSPAPPPELILSWGKVQVTGVTDQTTLDAIDALGQFRRNRFGPRFEVDGIISVVPPGTSDYDRRGTPYALVFLNYLALEAMPKIWPRIDQHAKCTPVLGAAIRQAISPDLQ